MPHPAADVVGGAAGEDQRFEQRIARQPVEAVHTGVRAFARGIQPVDSSVTVNVHVDAAHQIVLTGKHRDVLSGDVHPFLQTALVNHREAIADKFRAAEGDVQRKILTAGAGGLLHDAARNHVARRELPALVVALHKALAGVVEQQRPFAAHRLRDQEAFPAGGRRKGGRMELDQPQVFDPRPQLVSEGDAVAGRDRGVGGVRVYPADAAGAQNTIGTGQGAVILLRVEQPCPKAAAAGGKRGELGGFHKGDVRPVLRGGQ